MKKKSLLVLVVFFAFTAISINARAQHLQVQDPRAAWRSSQGTIEEAVLTVKPAGVYAEFGLYLSISGKGGNYTSRDTLEAQLFFKLNENCIVTDSWLWVEDTIVKAMLIDRWTAGLIYEGIVKRRQDPSIFYKNNPTNYEFRIFPLQGDKFRKVKITWLAPIDWSGAYPRLALPLSIIKLSRIIPSLSIHILENHEWSEPMITEFRNNQQIQFAEFESEFGKTKSLTLNPNSIKQVTSLTLSFTSQLKDGAFLKKYSDKENEGYYQLGLIPSIACDFAQPRKIALLVDYDGNKTTKTSLEIFDIVREQIFRNLTPKDSFTVMFSNLNIQPLSSGWLCGDAESVNNFFDGLNRNILASFSNLPSLIHKGIEFIKDNGNEGIVLVYSCSDQYGSQNIANQIGQSILDSIKKSAIKFYFADYIWKNGVVYKIGGNDYYGNEYLYSTIANITGGAYYRMLKINEQSEILNTLLTSTLGEVRSIEIITSVENGFCYSRYNMDPEYNNKFMNTPILQFGRYYGEFPLRVQFSGFLHGKPFVRSLELMPELDNDALTKTIWTGAYLRTLESTPNKSNELVKEIIDISMNNRILSLYTAFLALEPWMMRDSANKSQSEDDEGGELSNQNEIMQSQGFSVSAFPNPFSQSTRINITLPANISGDHATLKIYDVFGKLVKTINLTDVNFNGGSIQWLGDDENGRLLTGGVYIITLTTPEGSKVFKIIINR